MKNKILSKAYGGVTEARRKLYGLGLPRQWKVITSTLLLLFTLAIGNVLAATFAPENNPATKKYGDITFLDVANTKANGKITADGATFKGDSTLAYSLRYVGQTLAITTWYNCSDGSPASNFESSPTYADAVINGFVAPSSTSGNVGYGGAKAHSSRIRYFYATGITSVAIISHDNQASKYVQLKIEEVAEDGTLSTVTSIDSPNKSSSILSLIEYTTSLDPSKYYKISCTSNNTSNCKVYQIRFGKYIAPATKYSVTYKAGDGTGDDVVDSDAKTVKAFADCSFTAPSGYEFKEWQDGSSNVVAAGATVSADMTLTAIYRLIPTKYTVTYSLNGASGDAPTETDKAEGDVFNLAAAPSWAGHAFDGWLCSADAAVKAAGSSYTMTAANTTFTAQWHEVDCKIYSLTGGIGSAAAEADAGNVVIDASSLVLKSSNAIIKLTPGSGTFKAGDILTISGTVGNTSKNFGVKISASNNKGSGLGLASVAGTSNPMVATATLSADADYLYICRDGGTTQTLLTCEVHRSCAEGTAAGLSYAEASVNKYTTDAAFTNPLTNTNNLVLDGYKSSNEEVATVNFSTGEVTIVGEGSATITANSAVQTKAGTLYAAGTASYTLTVAAPPTFAVTYDNNGGDGTMTDSNSPYAEGAEVTLLDNTFTAPSGYAWSAWAVTETVSGNPVAVSEGKFTMPGVAVTVTAQWQLISDFDVKFFQGYGDPDVQIGATQVISTGNYATAPDDPTRAGFAFLGWSYDATEAHIVDVATYGITAATNFTAMWKAVWTVTFDGAGAVNVEDGETVASPNSPVMADKVFQGWYNAEVKYDFSAAVTGNLALTSKWADADPNHYVYAYNDDFHFDGVVYKTPEGAVDGGSGTSNIPMTTPYTLFEGAEGITSIVMTDGIYDSKTGAIQAVTALMKVNNNATSKLTVTIKSGYTATLKIKSSGYSATRTINVSDATPASGTTTGQAVTSGAMSVSGIGELSFALNSGSHDLTVTGGTLYIAELDIEATALPAHTVTYKPGYGGSELWVVDPDATEVRDGSTMFTAPTTGQVFNGWKDELDNDVEVGTIVTGDMTLTAQWINHYAVTFNMNGHGDAIDPQDIKEGAKATKPADPVVMGWDFGGWFTDAECTAGNEFDFETPITAATPLFAKWIAFDGCTLFYPATSGSTIAVGDEIASQTGSFGATMVAVSKDESCTLAYESYGLSFASSGNTSRVKVTLDHDIAIGTKITVTLVANGDKGSNRALDLYNSAVAKKAMLGWTSSDDYLKYDVATFSHTVTAEDAMAGTNEFYLYRNNSVYLQCLKVETCGDPIVFHNVTSAVNIAGKGTVTLGASSVREGYTTTAEYSEIDPLYEFVNWTVSGAGASVENATANPATITVGTEDAVVTLNLQLIPVKFTVNYFDGTTAMGTEQVVVNEHPTASEIETAKRGYIFEGWAETDGGSVVALNTITSDVAATINLYAVYTEIPCPTEGTVFSMVVTDPAGTEYNGNNEFNLEIGATYVGGKAYSGSKNSTKRVGVINENGEYSFENAGDVTVKVAMDCALQEGDVITFTTSTTRELKIQKVAGTDLVTTSGKKYVIPAASPLIGVYDFYLERGNSQSTMKTFNVTRPYTVSFEMQGHGDAIEAQKLIAGDKVAEPTAPTADGWDFKGWYKEPACTNAWDFENDVVAGTMALYAKWDVHVTNDATLKSLKYGSEAIALEDGVFEYNIGLPAMTVAVPALTAVANSATVHSLDIVDDAAFDVDGNATSTVTVVSEDETVTNVYTVNFSKLAALPQVNVTGSTTWNFSAGGSTTLTNQSDIVLANLPGINNDANFNSQALLGSFNKLEGTYFQGSKLSFTTEVPGKLTITFRGTNGNTRHLQACVGDGETVVADWFYNSSSTSQTKTIFVPEGKVTLKAFEGETPNNARIYQMIFNATPDYTRDVTEGRYGTICLPNGGVMIGAEIFEIAYYGESTQKVFLDNIINGEMEAGRPYIFLPKEGATQLAVFYTDEANADAGNHNGLIGFIGAAADEYYYIPAGEGNYILQNNLYREVLAGAQARILSNRAYIKLSAINPHETALAPGRRRISMSVQSEQVATGIENTGFESEAPRKVLINGELFIIRGEKMYDAKGQLVK